MVARSLKQVNEHLRAHGMPSDVELVKGKDYFYFMGRGTELWHSTSVYVCKLRDLPLNGWVVAYDELRS